MIALHLLTLFVCALAIKLLIGRLVDACTRAFHPYIMHIESTPNGALALVCGAALALIAISLTLT